MGYGFEIRLNMSTQTIMSNIDKLTNVTPSSKQAIINYCQNDLNGKVDELELIMLNAWASGQEKVPMPTRPLGTGWTHSKSDNGDEVYEKGNKSFYYKHAEDGQGPQVFYYETKHNSLGSKMFREYLRSDQDGYIGLRESAVSSGLDEIEMEYRQYDENMDGAFEYEDVGVMTSEANPFKVFQYKEFAPYPEKIDVEPEEAVNEENPFEQEIELEKDDE